MTVEVDILASSYKPLFPYFGGKSKIASFIWDAFGDPENYVEPFFGSGAVLFSRPKIGRIETVNDADGLLSNAWRSVQKDPESVAYYADSQVNECDLHARHIWLVGQRENITERLMGDPDYYDAKAAGWWIWGASCWIGGGWCSGKGPWVSVDGKITKAASGSGVKRQIPHLGDAGQGVNRKCPHLGNAGRGVNRKIPHLGGAGQGVNRLSLAGTNGEGNGVRDLIQWFSTRLRGVRVCCGNWDRVCGGAVTYGNGLTAVFLDPPYSAAANRDPSLYSVDCLNVADDVLKWARENGDNPLMRIAYCSYGEKPCPAGWRRTEWKASGGYGLQGEGRGRTNAGRETIDFSPHCLQSQTEQLSLFE